MFINNDIYVDIEKLNKIMCDFYKITGISNSVWDSNGNVLFGYPTNMPAFCDKINNDLEDRKHCHQCDLEALKICNSTQKPYSYICHAGAYELVIPLIFNGKCRLYFIFGQCICQEKEDMHFQSLLKYCEKQNLPVDYLKKDFYKLPRCSHEYFESLSTIAIRCFKSLLMDHTLGLRDEDILFQLDEYINSHLSEHITTQSICSYFFISKNALYALFKRFYNTTVNNYITQKRLEVAKNYLVSSSLSISEIASKVGKNYNDFTQTFKKYTSVTPTKYRKDNKYRI